MSRVTVLSTRMAQRPESRESEVIGLHTVFALPQAAEPQAWSWMFSHRDRNKQARMELIFMNIHLSKGGLLEDGSQTIRLCVHHGGADVLLELHTNGVIWNIRR